MPLELREVKEDAEWNELIQCESESYETPFNGVYVLFRPDRGGTPQGREGFKELRDRQLAWHKQESASRWFKVVDTDIGDKVVGGAEWKIAPREGLVLDRAMSAVTLSVVGRATKNTALAIESSRKYGQALWELQRALWDERLMYRDETLAACCALVLYELLESTGNNLMGWISHAQGVARLVEARGPDSFDPPLAHMMFKTFRQTIMIQDLQGRKASVFTSPEWQSGPWKKHRKGPDQTLYDIGADLATLLADADRCKSMQDGRVLASERVALVKNCGSLESKLEAWFDQLLEDIPAPHYWAEFSNIQNPLDDAEGRKLFPVSYRFPNIFIARILMDFWAISVLLHSTTLVVYRSLTGGTNPTWPEHPADDKRTPVLPKHRSMPPPKAIRQRNLLSSLADNIAQCMEYCLGKDMGTLGPQWALFGLRVAMQTYLYTPDYKKHQWLNNIHDRIADERGVKFSKTIATYDWETASSNESGEFN